MRSKKVWISAVILVLLALGGWWLKGKSSAKKGKAETRIVQTTEGPIEQTVEAAVEQGLTRDNALLLAKQTMLGTAKLLLQTHEHPAKLRDMVTSPGGTTIAGLHALERAGFRGTLMNAVDAATARSRELGGS